MTHYKWQHIVFNTCIALNCLLLFLLVGYAQIEVPAFLQVIGRAHPLVLHFPIVLLLLAFLFEILLTSSGKSIPEDIADWLLLAASCTTVIAALMGIFLSKEAGYEGNEVAVHKWTGVACSLISVVWYGLRKQIRRNKIVTTVTGICSSLLLLIAGHKGANITHGQDFLFASGPNDATPPLVALEDALVYTHLVQPIFESKCVGCHNADKAKGNLIMSTQDLLVKGGKNGKLWDTAAPDFGLMMQRLHLPLKSKEHMPPQGKPQLTETETRILYLWIKSGASFTQKVAALPEQDSLRMIATTLLKSNEADHYDFEAADERDIAGLNTAYRVITPVAQQSPALSVSFYGIAHFKSEQLNDLTKIKEQIVSLQVSKMPLADEDLKVIGSFRNLRDLNISFTDIKGDGLKYLKPLEHLRELSLSGTKINSKHLSALSSLHSLKAIKIWNTSITKDELTSLKRSFAHTNFDIGYSGDTVTAKLSTPAITTFKDKKVFSASTLVTIKNPIKSATVRYTLDGSDPDSLSSPKYEKPFTINQPTVVKAKAYLNGWISSDMGSASFFKSSLKPDSIQLITAPSPQYIENLKQGKAFKDEQLGGTSFNTPEWVGYKDKPLELYLFFNKPVMISSVTLSTLVSISSYIMPPATVEVWGGNDKASVKLLSKLIPAQPGAEEPAFVTGYHCSFPQQTVTVIKLRAQPVSRLPAWHPGKGQKAWVFVDELFLN